MSNSLIPSMDSQNYELHFLLVPLMSQSHLIPFTDLAKLLANHGVNVTIVLTPSHAARFSSILTAYNPKINVLSLPFPSRELGFPEGCESLDTLPSATMVPQFIEAIKILHQPLENWLNELAPLPDLIINDLTLPWVSYVGSTFNIPRITFHVISCFTMVCSGKLSQSKVHESVTSESEPFLVPDVPHRIELTRAQLHKESSGSNAGFRAQVKAAELSTQGIIMNTFEELEPFYVKEYEKVMNKKIGCVGPVFMCNKTFNMNDSELLNWLCSKKPDSVIYVCFGSLAHLSCSQLIELGLGLEESRCPFIWVIKQSDCSEELEQWLREESYEDRMKGRGLIIRGWAPQIALLSHLAVGGFLTHCGWNSTLEGVSAGVPMITWPMFAEQFLNEKLIVDVLNIGVKVGIERAVDRSEVDKVGVVVKKADVKNAIDKLRDEGEEGRGRRDRARKIGETARRTHEEGGSSHSSIKMLIQGIVPRIK